MRPPRHPRRSALAARALALALALASARGALARALAAPRFPADLVRGGGAEAVAALLERVLPGASPHFALALAPACPGAAAPCFAVSDAAGGLTAVSASGVNELAAGVGHYLREMCNMTVGWPRGGGSNVFLPARWPLVGAGAAAPLVVARSVPFSHVTQVCTHSYTLVWHDFAAWAAFIDWMALRGHNSIVAPTGQEEVQYKVMTALGVSDFDMRNWTNGPAFLTWSRGQNGHGSGIAGPLPRSFMQSQWALQRQILQRLRDLGIMGHLPAFQGNAPWALAVAQGDSANATRAGDTAWIDGRDPLFTKVADAWAAQIVADFGPVSHAWQMDAYFGNGTSWGEAEAAPAAAPAAPAAAPAAPVPCEWSAPLANTYLAGCPNGTGPCPSFALLSAAQRACESPALGANCGGVTVKASTGLAELRAGGAPLKSPDGETSYVLTNSLACKALAPDAVWLARGRAAYGAVARVDPDALWLYQGWALKVASTGLNPPSPLALSRLHGLSSAAPAGKFVIMDMETDGSGQWREWAASWGLPFIWTALHTFGGSMSLKGNLSLINAIPFDAPPLSPAPAGADAGTQVVGVGYTPEGLDQNPAYYELLDEAAFRSEPVENITAWLVRRAHRRYGLAQPSEDVEAAWAALGASAYARDESVSDGTGVGIVPGTDASHFAADLATPLPQTCLEWAAWGSLIAAAPAVRAAASALRAGAGAGAAAAGGALPETFSYDLVNTGREVLALLSTPVSQNFTRAIFAPAPLDVALINETAAAYLGLLLDLDALLGTDAAFLLGPWLAAARAIGGDAVDCDEALGGRFSNCAQYMAWNARSQLTTWYPTMSPNSPTPGQQAGRDNNYARKQWSGLVRDVYAARVGSFLAQALEDAAAGRAFDSAAMERRDAAASFAWQTDVDAAYPLTPTGDPVAFSTALRAKYAPRFAACGAAAASPAMEERAASPPPPLPVSASFDAAQPLFSLRASYASLNVDSGSLHEGFDFGDAALTQLTRNLARAAPTQLRIGGGAADNLYFSGRGGARGACSPPGGNSTFGVDICVDEAYFAQICAFASASGVEVVWDLNAALRQWTPGGALGPWNSSNAEALFTFLAGPAAPQPACPIAAWQLGNEVEDWYKRRGPDGAPMNMTGALLSADFASLRALLREPRFAGLPQSIYGPDACCEDRVTPPHTFVRDFAAAAAAAGTVDAVTIHIYPIPRFANNSCEPPLFTDKDGLASLVLSTLHYASWAAPLLRVGAPLIVGETATSAHGGCDGLSNRFVAGFALWYELGTYAELGVAQMNRQDLAGFSSETEPSNYGLLGPPGWFSGPLGQPHPDYFSLLLFKQLVGRRVLSSGFSAAGNLSSVFDSHVFCAAAGDGGAVVLTFFNMAGDAIVLAVPQLAAAQVPREEFLLTSSATPEAPTRGGVSDWPASLTADACFLNGAQMATNSDGSLPQWPVPGRVVTDPGEAIVLPPWSYGAIVFRDAGAAACK